MNQELTERERREAFLRSFKDLESQLIRISRLKDDTFISFSRALSEIYYKKLNPVVMDYDNYDFLKTAQELRNILSHENDVCAPSQIFLDKFNRICKAIISPLKAYDVATKNLICARPSDALYDALGSMDEHGISHLPILNQYGYVEGVLSRSSIFDYILEIGPMEEPEHMTLVDLKEVTGLYNHKNEAFLFVSRNKPVMEIYPSLIKRKAHDKVIPLVFVTEHGKADERLLGVISSIDLAKLTLDE